ncbi:MAG: response regulator [Candidatus Staskawiczbacteria bacterium]|nr:response regulator [Candidatus Staskawiczbacteria bacterium]
MENSSKKVLIVEDDKDFLWLLRQSFNIKDIAVFFAVDGEEGLEIVKKEKPDLVLIDILLPRMNGIEMAKKMKEDGISSQMIFLTNLRDPQHISEVMNVAVGADYIVKSDMHIDAIIERVKNKLGIK